MNPRSTPGRIVCRHLEDEIPDLLGWLLPSDSLFHPGDQAPVPAEAGTVPADHGLRRNDDERTLPSGPEPVCEHPEEFVQGADLWFAVLAFQYGELLPERDVLQ